MDRKIVSLDEKDQPIPRTKSSDLVITGLFQYDAAQQTSFEKRMSKENDGREAALADVIREHMSDLKLSSERGLNI